MMKTAEVLKAVARQAPEKRTVAASMMKTAEVLKAFARQALEKARPRRMEKAWLTGVSQEVARRRQRQAAAKQPDAPPVCSGCDRRNAHMLLPRR
tara:strand:- start:590 stop:874 length:285 start_codon:yes stop_codon:yes gene_type:complete